MGRSSHLGSQYHLAEQLQGLWRRLHAAIRVQDRQRPEIQVLLKALQQHPAV